MEKTSADAEEMLAQYKADVEITGSAKRWWRDYMLTRLAGSPAITWEQFPRLFLEKLIPITLREDYRRQFEHLQQGSMTVTQYKTHFVNLARRAHLLLPTEGKRARSDPRHIDRFFPRASGSAQQQGSRAIILVPAVPPPAQPARGRGQIARGGARPEAESSDVVIRSIVPICHRDASVLFDPGSTYSHVSSYFASYMVVPRSSLSASVCVSTPVGDSVMVDHVYRSCVVTIGNLETSVDLLLLDIVDYDVILDMDCLSPYHAILDCHAKMAQRMVENGCLAYLAYIRDPSANVPFMDSVPIVLEFPEVFPVDL
ncbi:uncharacterized protein [Nicotiana tomentosiformis]|uniref:uncharacterized protein n=1 Tax=Nicotiana tomentosiformis TaxID=4098 RepID=UPI00388CE96F